MQGNKVLQSYPNGYEHRRMITVQPQQGIAEDLDDVGFPISGKISFLKTKKFGGKIYSDRAFDIRFETEDGIKLSHKISSYKKHSGDIDLIVIKPDFKFSEGGSFYMYYGNPNVTETEEDVSQGQE